MLRRCRCREKLHCQQTIVLSSPLVFRPKQLKHFPVDQNNHVILVIKVRRYGNQFYRSSRVLVIRRSSNSSSSLGMGPTFPQCQSNFATEPFIGLCNGTPSSGADSAVFGIYFFVRRDVCEEPEKLEKKDEFSLRAEIH